MHPYNNVKELLVKGVLRLFLLVPTPGRIKLYSFIIIFITIRIVPCENTSMFANDGTIMIRGVFRGHIGGGILGKYKFG